MSALRRESTGDVSYLRRDGQGTPLVLLHGIGSNAQSFVPLLSALPEDRPVVAWDAPGYGDSKPMTKDWPRAGDYADVLDRLLGTLGITRGVMIGHSLGTLIAAHFAAAKPRQVSHLVLISPTFGYQAPNGGPMPANVVQRLQDLITLGAAGFAEIRAPGLLADPQGQPQLLAAVRTAMASVKRPGYDHAVRMLAQGRLRDDLIRVEAPTLVIVGSKDRTTPPAVAREAYAALDNMTGRHAYREIEGAAHAVCQEQPGAVAHAISEAIGNKATSHA